MGGYFTYDSIISGQRRTFRNHLTCLRLRVVFRNMLLDAKPSLQPIILDECSEAIKVFLDMATGQDVDRIPWEVPALEMAIKYDAPIVIKAMLATYRCHGDAPAVSWVWYWETFKTAVRYHNQPLARMAIRGLGGTAGSRLSFEQFTSNAARRLDGLAVRDYAELIRCCAQALEDGQEARGVDYWQKAAMTFRLD
jgi:hypothetical protein